MQGVATHYHEKNICRYFAPCYILELRYVFTRKEILAMIYFKILLVVELC
jgi:hypothetical protein